MKSEFPQRIDSVHIIHSQIKTSGQQLSSGSCITYCEYARKQAKRAHQSARLRILSIQEMPEFWNINVRVEKAQKGFLRDGLIWTLQLFKQSSTLPQEECLWLIFDENIFIE